MKVKVRKKLWESLNFYIRDNGPHLGCIILSPLNSFNVYLKIDLTVNDS